MIFQHGSFAVWNGSTFLYKSYTDEYELFYTDDIMKKKPAARIKKEHADCTYYMSAYCSINNIRCLADELTDGKCIYRPHNSSHAQCISVEECDEIWTVRYISVNQREINTLWLSPDCSKPPHEMNFYAELSENDNIYTSHLDTDLDIETTIRIIKTHYNNRTDIRPKAPSWFGDDRQYQIFRIDADSFEFLADWGIIRISPSNSSGNKYIHEIIDLFNEWNTVHDKN